MTRTKFFTHALLAGITLLTVSAGVKASAEPVFVTQGSQGAVRIVDSENIPVGARRLPQSPARPFPNLVTRGSNGAAHIVTASESMTEQQQVTAVPKVITRGPNGAGVIGR